MKIIDKQSTKIVSTLGPASTSEEIMRQLVIEGVDMFRLNFSHGEHATHLNSIRLIDKINAELGTHVGIIADLQGPKLRVGRMPEEGLLLEQGQKVVFTNKDEGTGRHEAIYMSYEDFAGDVKKGEKVLLDDGKLILKVLSTNGKDRVELEVIAGGRLYSNKGVNLPNTRVSLPCLTEKDLEDLDFILKQPVHWIALSFVRSADDVKALKEIIAAKGHAAKVIAKIEKAEALSNINAIIKASDAIMIARGDLGIEMPIERLPALQKRIIRKCRDKARPVVVATQMMESMMNNPTPTRAEVTDVANAVLDGTDAVMLSGETAVGKYPVEVVQTMNRILGEAEAFHTGIAPYRPKPDKKSKTFLSDVVCYRAVKTAEDVKAKGIIGLTVSGYTAFTVSSYRPQMKIYIFSSEKHMLSTLNLVWGVRCFFYDKMTTTDETFEDLQTILKKDGRIHKGDVIVNTASMPIYRRLRTNMLKVSVVE